MHVFMSIHVSVCVCVCRVHTPVTWSVSVCSIYWIYCALPLQAASAANFFSHVVKLEWIGHVLPEGMQRSEAQWKTTEAGCQEEHTNSYLIKRKGNTGKPTRKVFSVQGFSRLCSPIRVGQLSKMPVGYSEQWALWIRNPWLCDIPPMWAKWLNH